LSGLCDDVHLPPHQAGSLLHADQAKSASVLPHRLEIEAGTVVSDGQLDVPVGSGSGHAQPARIAVGGRVPQGLLRYSKQAQCRIVADVTKVAFRRERHLSVVLLLDFDAVRLQGASEADVPQGAGVQVMRQTPNAFDQTERATLKRRQHLLGRRVLNVAAPAFESADGDGEAGQFLTHVVMKVARNSGAGGLLRVDESAGQLPDAFIARPEGSFVRPDGLLGAAASGALSEEGGDENRLQGDQ